MLNLPPLLASRLGSSQFANLHTFLACYLLHPPGRASSMPAKVLQEWLQDQALLS